MLISMENKHYHRLQREMLIHPNRSNVNRIPASDVYVDDLQFDISIEQNYQDHNGNIINYPHLQWYSSKIH